jgi:hypothetical protein
MRGAVVVAAVVGSALAARAAHADDARVSSARGPVEAQVAGGPWAPAAAGVTFAAGARIATRDEAAALLAFSDDGRMTLRAGAVVALGAGNVRATVEAGGIEQDLTDATERVRLRTRAAQIEQDGGTAVVTVDADGVTRVANTGDAAVAVHRLDAAGKVRGSRVKVAAGAGVRIAPGRAPGRAKPLPATPAWTTAAARAVSVAGRPAAVRAVFAPVAGQTRYRVWIRTQGGDPISAVDVAAAGESGAITLHRLRPGLYTARVVALGADGFESAPSADLPIEVIDLPAVAAGRDEVLAPADDAGDLGSPAPAPVLTVGARLVIPAALTCQLGDDVPTSPVVITRVGPIALRCHRGADEVAAPLLVGESLAIEVANAPHLVPRRATTLTFTLRDPAAAPAVDAVGTGVRVLSVEAGADGLRVTVEPPPRGGRLAHLDLVLRDAPEISLKRVALAIEVTDEAPRPRGAPTLDVRFAGAELGAFAGYLALPSDAGDAIELGDAGDPAYRVASGPTFGARLAIWPTHRVGIEAEVGVTPTDYAAADDRATVVAARGQLALRIVQDGRFGLRAAAGAGVLTLVSGAGAAHADTDGEVHWGLGFTIDLPRRLQVRLDARHLLAPARDGGFANAIEATTGLGVRL